MSPTLQLILGGSLLGVLQIAAGVAFGLWLRRPGGDDRDADLLRAHEIAHNLHDLTHQISGTMDNHRSRFEAAEQTLLAHSKDKQQPTTELVIGVVAEILMANRQLQDELTQAQTQLAEQTVEIESHLTTSLTDSLTNLPNRRALDEQLARRLEDYRKQGTPFSLLMVDADHFKQINDTFGHPVGDEVLKEMGAALKDSLRRHDFVARFGGEEFAIILPYTSLDEAQRAAAKAAEGVGRLTGHFTHLDRDITASGGLASIAPGEEVATLIRRADEALYAAKQNGRNCSYFHDGACCHPLDEQIAEDAPGAVAVEESTSPTTRSADLQDACGELRAALVKLAETSAASTNA